MCETRWHLRYWYCRKNFPHLLQPKVGLLLPGWRLWWWRFSVCTCLTWKCMQCCKVHWINLAHLMPLYGMDHIYRCNNIKTFEVFPGKFQGNCRCHFKVFPLLTKQSSNEKNPSKDNTIIVAKSELIKEPWLAPSMILYWRLEEMFFFLKVCHFCIKTLCWTSSRHVKGSFLLVTLFCSTSPQVCRIKWDHENQDLSSYWCWVEWYWNCQRVFYVLRVTIWRIRKAYQKRSNVTWVKGQRRPRSVRSEPHIKRFKNNNVWL